MSTPTPDEITTALNTLLRVPGVDGGHSLNAVAEIASPLVQMARELRVWLHGSTQKPDLGQLASQLETFAARHGLRITTDPDPGELIGYDVARHDGDEWVVDGEDGHWSPTAEGLARARMHSPDSRVAALYLLPEGGQA